MSRLPAAAFGHPSISVVSSSGADAPPSDYPDESSDAKSYWRSITSAAVLLDGHSDRREADPTCNIAVGSFCSCTFLTRPTCASACHDTPNHPVDTGRPQIVKEQTTRTVEPSFDHADMIRYSQPDDKRKALRPDCSAAACCEPSARPVESAAQAWPAGVAAGGLAPITSTGR